MSYYTNIIDTFIKAAEGSRNYHAFAKDMQRCKEVIDTSGLPQIKAEVWVEHMEKMTLSEIYEYVENRYFPGILNPYDPRT